MEKVELPEIKNNRKLPSSFQIGDFVHVEVTNRHAKDVLGLEHSILYHGKVVKVHFATGKVTYDLEFTVSIDNNNQKRYVTRIHNVDSALCCGVDEYERTETESPFEHAGWHRSNETPKDLGEGMSEYVLIDLNGHRKEFQTGWYDHDDKEWRFHVDDISMLELENLKWCYLPLERTK